MPVRGEKGMRIDPGRLGWAIFLIITGGVPLAVQAGFLGATAVAGWWRLWPLLLVGAGLGLLLRATQLESLGGLLVATVLGLLVGGVLAAGSSIGFGALGCGPDGGTMTPFDTARGSAPGEVRLDVTLDCGQLDLDTVPGDAWSVGGSSANGAPPNVESVGGRLDIRSVGGVRPAIGLGSGNRVDWQISVPETATVYRLTVNAGSAETTVGGAAREVAATVNAGALFIDLERTRLRTIDVTVNAGGASIILPAATTTGSLTANAGAIRLCVPPGVGLRIATPPGTLGAYELAGGGLTRDEGGVWTSPDWSSATNRITLAATANAGGISLNPEDGCR